MKIFISWSGHLSHEVAIALRDWLPDVIQSIVPYVSDEDIEKGSRWSNDIASTLSECNFGIVVVTRENVAKPWINFEAGALAKSFDQARVVPLLVDGISKPELQAAGPLGQFQASTFDKTDVRKMLQAIRSSENPPSLNERQLENAFERAWPDLAGIVNGLVESGLQSHTDGNSSQLSIPQFLELILENLHNMNRTMKNPASFLPREYVEEILVMIDRMHRRPSRISLGLVREVVARWDEVRRWISRFDHDAEGRALLTQFDLIMRDFEISMLSRSAGDSLRDEPHRSAPAS